MSTPKISVVMPVFNALSGTSNNFILSTAIDSILVQDFEDWELIIANDGSTDETLDALHALTKHDDRVRVLDRPRSGISGALNAAIDEARADYIARMDADDISVVYRLGTQKATLDANPDIGITGSGMWVINGDDQIIMEINRPTQHEDILRFCMQYGCPFVHGSVMFRKSVFLEAGRYNADCPAEDYDLWYRILSISRGHNHEEPMYLYRQHAGNLSSVRASEIAAATGEITGRFISSFSHLSPYSSAKAFS